MRAGVVQQVGKPSDLYRDPANLFVAGFIGSPAMNLIQATLTSRSGSLYAEFGASSLEIDAGRYDLSALAQYRGRIIVLGIRPEHMQDASFAADAPESRRISAVVDIREEMGSEAYVYFRVAAPPVLTEDVRELAADTDSTAVEHLEAQARAEETQ